MNIATSSPAFVLVFIGILLWILMDIHFQDFTRIQRWVVPISIITLAVLNHILRHWLGSAVYGQLLILTMHLPYFLLFLWITRCGVIKMTFMIFTAVIFMAPTVILGNFVKNTFASSWGLFFANLITYAAVLTMAHMVFRASFNYMIKHGDTAFLLHLFPIPFLYYMYLFAVMNLDFSALKNAGGTFVRLLPTIYVFVFYFLILRNYQELNEKRELEVTQTVLTEQLDSAKKQIALLREGEFQTAIHRHDLRHHLAAIDGYLSVDKPQQASQYIKEIQENIESFTPKQYCENELANLLCSSFAEKSQRMKIRMNIHIRIPESLPISDTELCSILSNGLENAIQEVTSLDDSHKWIDFYCSIKKQNLLIEIRNPYFGKLTWKNGLPVSEHPGHGYGCQSIYTVTQHHKGSCSFELNDQVFTMRIMLPILD